jgi:hypothetical protein
MIPYLALLLNGRWVRPLLNFLLDAEIQLKAAASPRRLCSGQRER